MASEAFSEYKFEELDLCKELKKGLAKIGFEQMTPIQAEAIPVLLKGKDVIGQAQTGTGKTAAFGLPILDMIDPDNKKLQAIILCPTRELAMQVASELRNFAVCMQNVKLLPVYGGQDIRQQIQGLKGTQIVVGTPGRVMDHMRRKTIKMNHVKMVVLDEADEMLKMGFREDMEVILGAIEQPHQTCLFSATMPQEILEITERFQCNPEHIKVAVKELTMERITQYYYAVKREYKTKALTRLMDYHQYKKSIVFCNTKAMTDELATELKKIGYHAEALHGDLSQKQRDIVMKNFRTGATNVLIATDIAARGIDVDDVEAVFNYDIPQETEYYVHRIGRTGRAGREGVSHTFCKNKEFRKIREIENICNSKMEERTVPTPTNIINAKTTNVLNAIKDQIDDDVKEKYTAIITGFCAKHEIDVVDFAAAALKMELGELLEEDNIDVGLPQSGGKHGHKGGKKHGGDGNREGRKEHRGHKDGYKNHKDRKEYKVGDKVHNSHKDGDSKKEKVDRVRI